MQNKSEKQINISNNITEQAPQEPCLEKINSNSSNLTTPQPTADIVSQISMEPEQINLFSDIAIASSTAKEELFETSEEEVNKLIDDNINSEHNFYNLIADQLEELFIRYPREKNLEQLIDNSIWCKIDTDIDNKYYVVGIIKVKNDIKYICYGVPGNYNVEPPIEMRGYSQWLPVDTTNPYEKGYWVMYQDSDTGENIFLN